MLKVQKVKNNFFKIWKFCTVCFLFTALSSCQFFETEKISSEEFYEEELKMVTWNEIDQYPTFSLCEDLVEKKQQKTCFEETISNAIYDYISSKNIVASKQIKTSVILELMIQKTGKIKMSSIEIDSITQAEIPLLENWLNESIDNIPPLNPALKRGIPVTTQFQLPIVITTN